MNGREGAVVKSGGAPVGAAALTPNRLTQGLRVDGLDPHGQAVIVATLPRGEFTEIVYRSSTRQIQSIVLPNEQIADRLRVSPDNGGPTFDADPRDFKLAAEALRIGHAAQYDPVAAVHSSNVEPLPHQIRAVYEELLPRTPLRFLLADDPGAGKTIMAGLYIKELRLRSALDRCLIVAPGALVEQWQDELREKFELSFELLTNQLVDASVDANVFTAHPFLIARMDQLARNDSLRDQLTQTSWDLTVVDEAHRMSAHYTSFNAGLKPTKRFELGRILSQTSRNFLLMTATPHSGNEDDFQAFMSLLDPDRFAGKYREGVHRTDTRGLMRRMVKEDLLTFDGKPLFPERKAETVSYTLTPAEMGLYEQVTDYVRHGMSRADEIGRSGDKRRAGNIGFALTMLQRRLASSPEAILRSLERRRDRLTDRLKAVQERIGIGQITGEDVGHSFEAQEFEEYDDPDSDVTDSERAEFEDDVDEVVDLATASQSVAELKTEIEELGQLVREARVVRVSDTDTKWNQLSSILQDNVLRTTGTPSVDKLIVFTEHKDTVNYLVGKIRNLLGDDDAVVTIHGGVRRDERRRIQTEFTEDPQVRVLVATDAAGEGLNLQRAHLMVNYDLPWNPNRIEQRFGRIHRIGQRQVCSLWNLVASDTREGQVFERLLTKIGEQRKAYNGNLFNVLGEGDAFHDRPLRELLIEAIRYGSDPQRQEELNRVVDESVADGLREVAEHEALYQDVRESVDVQGIRDRMDRAKERRLQPGFIRDFFIAAFRRLGGRISERERGCYAVGRVPERIRERARHNNHLDQVPERFERVTFENGLAHLEGSLDASLIAPGHPLLTAVIDLTLDDCGDALRRGTVLVDNTAKQGDAATLLFAVEQRTVNGLEPPETVDQYLSFLEVDAQHHATVSNLAPYIDYDPSAENQRQRVSEELSAPWLRESHEDEVAGWSARVALEERLPELRDRLQSDLQRVRVQVRDRLTKEANFWENEARDLEDAQRNGKHPRRTPEYARRRAEVAQRRIAERGHELDLQGDLRVLPADVRGVALVIPGRLLPSAEPVQASVALPTFARETKAVERRAVDKVLATERALGRIPHEMPFNNKGFDIRSDIPGGGCLYIEVKGRVAGAPDFMITTNEINFSQSQGDNYRLAMVEVSADGPTYDTIRYVRRPFEGRVLPSDQTKTGLRWTTYWSKEATDIS